jgi:hypothetical protein
MAQLVLLFKELLVIFGIVCLLAFIVAVVISIYESIQRAKMKSRNLKDLNKAYDEMIKYIEEEEKKQKGENISEKN